MPSVARKIASPLQHNKTENVNKSRLTPSQCRKVRDHWEFYLGKDKATALVEKYTDPTGFPSNKDAGHLVPGSLAHKLHHDWSVPSAHSDTGGRRNPGRNDGLTWKGDSFISPGQIDIASDYSDLDPFSDLCPICEERYEVEASIRRPQTFSLGDVLVKFSKAKRPKAEGYEVLPPVPQVSSVPPSESGESSAHENFDTRSNSSWEVMSPGFFSEEDWEDSMSTHAFDTLGLVLDQDLNVSQVPRNDPYAPSTTPPRMTYAQALSQKLEERQK